MKALRMLALAIALAAPGVGTVPHAFAQQWGMMQGQDGDWDDGYMMGPWMMGGGMGPGMMGWYGRGAAMCGLMTSHIEGRLAFLRTELRIAEAQATLWETYAQAARANAEAMAGHCTAMMDRDDDAALTLPDRLDRHEQFMAAQLEAMHGVNVALKPLYAVLDADQKAMADRLVWGPMGPM